jgi:hypothetical protein
VRGKLFDFLALFSLIAQRIIHCSTDRFEFASQLPLVNGVVLVPFRAIVGQAGVHRFAALRGDAVAESIDDDVPLSEQLTIDVIELTLETSSMPLSLIGGTTMNRFANIVTIRNPSRRALSDIRIVVGSQSGRLVATVGDGDGARLASLAAGANASVSLTLDALQSGVDRLSLTATSAEGASAQLTTLSVTIVERRSALLLVDDSALKASVPFDEARLLTFRVRNAAPTIVVRDIVVELGNASAIFALVGGRYATQLEPNATMTVQLRVLVSSMSSMSMSSMMPRRTLIGTLTVRANDGMYATDVPFEITATSTASGSLLVLCEDQLTYYDGNGTLVTNASARLFDSSGALAYERHSNATTMAELLFDSVVEGDYELRVDAPGHASARTALTVHRGVVNRITVFLSRTLVSFVWRVVEFGVQDRYAFVLDAEFQTNVPSPVLDVQPESLKVEQTCDAAMLAATRDNSPFVVRFNVTNHGLIRADNVRFEFPSDNPLLTFEKLTEPPSSIDARRSAIVPVAVRVRHSVTQCALPPPTVDRKRQSPSSSSCDAAFLWWSIECGGGDKVTIKSVGLEFEGLPCPGRAGPLPSYSVRGGGDLSGAIASAAGSGSMQFCKIDTKEPPEEQCKDNIVDAVLECGALAFPEAGAVKKVRDLLKFASERDVAGAAQQVSVAFSFFYMCMFGR